MRAAVDVLLEILVDEGVTHIFGNPGSTELALMEALDGSGLRYVKARLNECWPGAWDFHHGPVDGGWETSVELRRGRGRSAACLPRSTLRRLNTRSMRESRRLAWPTRSLRSWSARQASLPSFDRAEAAM